jgi:predicted glycogen debranching enzyme
VSLLGEVQFGREVCGNLEEAEKREWLVTNGLGGYASQTIAGTTTRRYHGLLVAALEPPAKRTVLVNSLDVTARYQGNGYALSTNRWTSGFVSPNGYLQIESFHLEGTKPVWRYALADALLEKRVWMKQGENSSFVQFTLLRGRSSVELEGKVLANYRDFHSTLHAQDRQMRVERVENGVRVVAFEGATPFYLKSTEASFEPQREWYRDYLLPVETERGLDDSEDRLYAARFQCRLGVGEKITLVFTTVEKTGLDGEQARAEQANHEGKLFEAWQRRHAKFSQVAAEDEPGWLWQLVLAADQFVVRRYVKDELNGQSIIAGYHWFNDWGRDAMISLPGLTLATGRPEIARRILRCWSRYADGGMLPNNLPEDGGAPRYNTVDATLWYFEALRQYYEATKDLDVISELFALLAAIIDAHVLGTRYNIKVDPADALLVAGNAEEQLTWMDAKVGDRVVTPRTGKPVEVNALWINALNTMLEFARLLGRPGEGYARLGEKAERHFQKFWNPRRDCCFDVIDIPGGGQDATLRPNQIFAVSLHVSPLSVKQQQSVVDAVAQELLTSHGLRSFGPFEPGYQGHFGGGPRERDSAYHQGTVWAWLLGAFSLAHYRVYQNREAAQGFLEPLGRAINSGGLGSIGEVFDGDPPFLPGGCIAQAWSVAETLRAWEALGAAK